MEITSGLDSNSKVAEWYFEQVSTTSGMVTNRWEKYKIE
jgi:adenine-specific DNA-methyltransferase